MANNATPIPTATGTPEPLDPSLAAARLNSVSKDTGLTWTAASDGSFHAPLNPDQKAAFESKSSLTQDQITGIAGTKYNDGTTSPASPTPAPKKSIFSHISIDSAKKAFEQKTGIPIGGGSSSASPAPGEAEFVINHPITQADVDNYKNHVHVISNSLNGNDADAKKALNALTPKKVSEISPDVIASTGITAHGIGGAAGAETAPPPNTALSAAKSAQLAAPSSAAQGVA